MKLRIVTLLCVTAGVAWCAHAGGATSASGVPAGLEAWLDADGAIWKLSGEQFIGAHGREGFVWESTTKKDTARSVNPRLSFAGQRVWEAIGRFEGDKLKELSLFLYNRGDAGDLDETQLDKLVTTIDQAITELAGAKGTALKSEDRTTSATIMRKAWLKGPHRLDLIWSFTAKHKQQGVTFPYRAEYVRLQIARAGAGLDSTRLVTAPTATPTKQLTPAEMRARVTRTPTGDVMIAGVPMVDQGQKGYCAVAVAERVLRYYGKQFDQHEIAQLANTSSGAGTNPEAMIAALRRVGDKLDVQINIQDDFKVTDFEKLLRDYNRAAKSANKAQIQISFDRAIDLMDIYHEMDTDLLKQTRLKRDASMTQFKTAITKYVNAGVPLAWSVMLGKIKEPHLPQAMGGHMRLIIGFNDRASEIIYSDTWGAGHEQKRMSLAEAWAITLGLYTIEPRGMRF